jgi:hypothetical protein
MGGDIAQVTAQLGYTKKETPGRIKHNFKGK